MRPQSDLAVRRRPASPATATAANNGAAETHALVSGRGRRGPYVVVRRPGNVGFRRDRHRVHVPVLDRHDLGVQVGVRAVGSVMGVSGWWGYVPSSLPAKQQPPDCLQNNKGVHTTTTHKHTQTHTNTHKHTQTIKTTNHKDAKGDDDEKGEEEKLQRLRFKERRLGNHHDDHRPKGHRQQPR